MGRAAPPGRHGRAEGRHMPQAGQTFCSARGTTNDGARPGERVQALFICDSTYK